MELAETVRIIKTKSGNLHETAAAATLVHSFNSHERPDLLAAGGHLHHRCGEAQVEMSGAEFDALLQKLRGRTTMKRTTRDQVVPTPQPTVGSPTTQMGANPEGGVGGELVQRLPGGITDYFVSAIDDDVGGVGGGVGVGVYKHTQANDKLNPGKVYDFLRQALARSVRVRDAAQSVRARQTLSDINKRNRGAWGQ